MRLSWQQGPFSPGAIGRFLLPEPLPKRLLYAEPLRRRMRVRFGGAWIADSENVILLFEPGHYPIAYFPKSDVSADALEHTEHTTQHHDLGLTSWYTVRAGEHSAPRGAWQHVNLPDYACELQGRIAFAWPAMDAFYEEDERIVGHAADSYHRIDIRQTSRNLVVRHSDRIIADTRRPLVLYESGFAPRWYVPRAEVDESALTLVEHQTFCPYKGVCNYYAIGDAHLAAWSYRQAYPEVGRISDLLSFEPDIVSVHLDGKQLRAGARSNCSPPLPRSRPHRHRGGSARKTALNASNSRYWQQAGCSLHHFCQKRRVKILNLCWFAACSVGVAGRLKSRIEGNGRAGILSG
ncbi:MAG TPA: DUF427 domain-containing protein [Candidatus Acidoferrum sp.]|nr:DUF427 domain-containing protein [Candidatus Acidoferrum sp.]